MFFLVYKIINLVNGRYYIGCHKTENKDDGYIGSGKLIKAAIKKYGIEKFQRDILFEADSADAMFAKERELVEIGPQSYNLKEGGHGGWDHVNKQPNGWKHIHKKRTKEDYKRIARRGGLAGGKACLEKKRGIFNPNFVNLRFTGKSCSTEHKNKIGKANSIHQSGKNNSQFGMMWITNLETKQSERIKNDREIPYGWIKGRVIK
jgi:hypothetical protein